jgi:hypothetical protein
MFVVALFARSHSEKYWLSVLMLVPFVYNIAQLSQKFAYASTAWNVWVILNFLMFPAVIWTMYRIVRPKAKRLGHFELSLTNTLAKITRC